MAGIVSSSAYALSAAGLAEGWKPVIGWHSVVSPANLVATTAAAGYPVSNLGNSSTVEGWRGTSTAPHYLTSLFDPTVVDYAGAARHNWGSGFCHATPQGLYPDGDPEEPSDWVDLMEPYQPADDGPLLFRFVPALLVGLRLKLEPTTVAPRLAVLKAGKLIVLQRGLPTGHQPIPYARTQEMANQIGQGGDYLGSVITSSQLTSSIDQRNLDPAWYRNHLEPFRLAQPDPFFWAWAPKDHPTEVGYVWANSDPIPVVSQKTGAIDLSFAIAGITR